MAYVDWSIKGPEITTCNCDWGCPCQFNALPSHGDCRAAVAFRIDEGHFGDVRLDGLKSPAWLRGRARSTRGMGRPWHCRRARNARQREALLKLSGQETEPSRRSSASIAAMTEKFHEPLFKPIEFETNEEERPAGSPSPESSRRPPSRSATR